MNMAKLMNFFAIEDIVDTSSISNTDLANAMAKLGDIVNTIMIVIYIVLGLFLIIKGALLGFQIIKAADEPQVRQEKIGSLKWLVIGVAIGYGVAGVAHVLISVVSGSLELQ